MSVETPVARVGAVGDIHCQDEALQRALDAFEDLRVDLVVSVGDLVDGTGDPDRVITLLQEKGVLTVRGNHDRWFLEGARRDVPDATTALTDVHRAWLAELPTTRIVETIAGPLLIGHGVGSDDMQVLRPDTRGYALQAAISHIRDQTHVRFFMGGHTHERMVRTVGPFVFINVGTLAPSEDPCIAVLDFEQRAAIFYDLDADLQLGEGTEHRFGDLVEATPP